MVMRNSDGVCSEAAHGHDACFTSEGLELHVHDSGWRLIGKTPSVDWMVDSSVLLAVHGQGLKGDCWLSKLENGAQRERAEKIEGFGNCRIFSVEGDMTRCVIDRPEK